MVFSLITLFFFQVPCINVRPYVFHDLMMTLPDFVRHFYPELSIEKARHMLQDILKVVLYKGNTGHQEILRGEGKCNQFDPVPLVLVKDIMNYMPQMKYMFNNIAATTSTGSEQPSSKRARVSWPTEDNDKSSIAKSIFHSSPSTIASSILSSHLSTSVTRAGYASSVLSTPTSSSINNNQSLIEPSGFGLGNLWF